MTRTCVPATGEYCADVVPCGRRATQLQQAMTVMTSFRGVMESVKANMAWMVDKRGVRPAPPPTQLLPDAVTKVVARRGAAQALVANLGEKRCATTCVSAL